MPTYDYLCPEGHSYTEQRGMTEPQRRHDCPTCGQTLKRVYVAAPIHFLGSGFYRTDNK